VSPNGRIAPLNLSVFAAVHESAYGTKRTIAALQQFVRYWGNNGHAERVLAKLKKMKI
jgi:hypothetical protein